jgi:hypothetical protein
MGFNAAPGYPGQEDTFKPDCPATIWVMHPWLGSVTTRQQVALMPINRLIATRSWSERSTAV